MCCGNSLLKVRGWLLVFLRRGRLVVVWVLLFVMSGWEFWMVVVGLEKMVILGLVGVVVERDESGRRVRVIVVVWRE